MNIRQEVLQGAVAVQERLNSGETIESINASFRDSNREAMRNMHRWFERLANDLNPITGELLTGDENA